MRNGNLIEDNQRFEDGGKQEKVLMGCCRYLQDTVATSWAIVPELSSVEHT